MRSVPAGSFARFTTIEALWRAWLACRRGKRRSPGIAAFDVDADLHVVRLHRALRNGRYRPGSHRLSVVRDPKLRLVAAPPIVDRVVHRALLDDIGPTYERGFIAHSFACLTGRGVHRAVLHHLALMRSHRYRLAVDVRRYFPSVRHDVLYELFARRLRDPDTRALIQRLISHGGAVYRTPLAARTLGLDRDPLPPGCGLPLGGYLSHWSGGLYLDGLDHYVKRTLRIRAYLRYMDDMVLFSDDRAHLLEARAAMVDWLWRERGLVLKPHRGASDGVTPTTQPCTYLGCRVSRAGVLPGPKAKRRLRARLQNAHALGPERLARSLRSYRASALAL